MAAFPADDQVRDQQPQSTSKIKPEADTSPGAARRFDSRELFGDATEISITHEQAIYRLRITRQGKLILNK